jgi:parallel beta-helix repeat protein
MNYELQENNNENEQPRSYQNYNSILSASQNPNAHLTGNYSAEGYDSDGDGQFNELIFRIGVNVTYPGKFRIEVEIRYDSSSTRIWKVTGCDFEIGGRLFNVSIDGFELYEQKSTSSYTLEIVMLGWVENNMASVFELETVYYPFTTRIYDYMEFEGPGMFLTETFADWGVDSDDDGLYDELIIQFEVNVSDNDKYYIELLLDSLQGKKIDWEEEIDPLGPGIHNISILIPSSRIYSLHENTTLLVSLKIINSGLQQIFQSYNIYETRLYNHSEFEYPSAYFTGRAFDKGYDSDRDTRFNKLEILFEINITARGEFRIEGLIRSDEGDDTFLRFNDYFWEVGIRNFSITVEAYNLYPRGENTSYTLLEGEVKIQNLNNTLLDQSFQTYKTRYYHYTEFDIDRLIINGHESLEVLARDENWLGDGTPSNPYIIEGLEIKAPKRLFTFPLISISNIDLHFQVKNCILDGGATGISLFNVANATIVNNLIQNNDFDGISLKFSHKNIILANTINWNTKGILLGGKYSYNLETANNNQILNNTICNNKEYGIFLGFRTKENQVNFNDFKNNGLISVSHGKDSGENNVFLSNFWGEESENEHYSIDGIPENKDYDPQNTPNHMNSPKINFPSGGEYLKGNIDIQWRPINDTLNHNVTYSIYYSSDNRSSWNLIIAGLRIPYYIWDTSNMSRGAYLIQIQANDSFDFLVWMISEPFTLVNSQSNTPLLFRIVILGMIIVPLILLFTFKKRAG